MEHSGAGYQSIWDNSYSNWGVWANTLIHLYGEAGVSKATLYNNDVLKERILRLRAIEKSAANGVIIATPKDKIQAKDDKIKQLYEEIKNLKKINRI